MSTSPRVAAVLTAVWFSNCTPWYVTASRETCVRTPRADCGAALSAYASHQREDAREAYRRYLAALASACDHRPRVAQADAADEPADPDAMPARERITLPSLVPSEAEQLEESCLVLTALRLRASTAPVLQQYQVPVDLDPDAVPAGVTLALADLRDLCAAHVVRMGNRRSEACMASRELAATAERPLLAPPTWITPAVRRHIASGLLAEARQTPHADPGADPRLQRAAALLSDGSEAATPSDAQARAFAPLEAWLAQPSLTPPTRDHLARASGAERRAARGEVAAVRARHAALLGRIADAMVHLAETQGTYLPALTALQALAAEAGAGREEVARRTAALREAGGSHYAARARQHLAARRFGLARMYARVAQGLGATVDVAEAEAHLAGQILRPALAVRLVGDPCAWGPLVIPPPPRSSERDVARVEVRWTTCASEERRWTTRETRTYEAFETVTTPVIAPRRVERGSALRCVTAAGPCRMEPTYAWENAPTGEVRTERRPVQRSEEIEVQHRALRTAVGAQLTIQHRGQTVQDYASWSVSPLEEEQATRGRTRSTFSTETLEAQRARAAARTATWLGPGGEAHFFLNQAASRTLQARAAATTPTDPDAGDELLAQAFNLDPNVALRGGDLLQALAQRHNLPLPEVTRALRTQGSAP
jgi:hypothetical protein